MAVYQVVDIKTDTVVGTYKTRVAASRAADRKDQEYGAYRFFVRITK